MSAADADPLAPRRFGRAPRWRDLAPAPVFVVLAAAWPVAVEGVVDAHRGLLEALTPLLGPVAPLGTRLAVVHGPALLCTLLAVRPFLRAPSVVLGRGWARAEALPVSVLSGTLRAVDVRDWRVADGGQAVLLRGRNGVLAAPVRIPCPAPGDVDAALARLEACRAAGPDAPATFGTLRPALAVGQLVAVLAAWAGAALAAVRSAEAGRFLPGDAEPALVAGGLGGAVVVLLLLLRAARWSGRRLQAGPGGLVLDFLAAAWSDVREVAVAPGPRGAALVAARTDLDRGTALVPGPAAAVRAAVAAASAAAGGPPVGEALPGWAARGRRRAWALPLVVLPAVLALTHGLVAAAPRDVALSLVEEAQVLVVVRPRTSDVPQAVVLDSRAPAAALEVVVDGGGAWARTWRAPAAGGDWLPDDAPAAVVDLAAGEVRWGDGRALTPVPPGTTFVHLTADGVRAAAVAWRGGPPRFPGPSPLLAGGFVWPGELGTVEAWLAAQAPAGAPPAVDDARLGRTVLRDAVAFEPRRRRGFRPCLRWAVDRGRLVGVAALEADVPLHLPGLRCGPRDALPRNDPAARVAHGDPLARVWESPAAPPDLEAVERLGAAVRAGALPVAAVGAWLRAGRPGRETSAAAR